MLEDKQPFETRSVPFYGDQILAIENTDGSIYVLFSRVCDNLGLDRRSQLRRLQGHDTLAEGLTLLHVQTEGGPQAVQCLRLDLLPLWLASIQVRAARADIKPKLSRYQREAATVLWNHFRPRVVQSTPDDASILALQRIADNARAIAQLAEQQIEYQRQTNARLDKAGHVVRDLQVRMGILEDRLQPASLITDEQAAEISNIVKALAELMTAKDASKNHYQGIFAELYRRFGVSSYKNIRQGQYQAVLSFLDDWRQAAQKAGSQAKETQVSSAPNER